MIGVKVATLFFLCITRLRFPSDQSIADIIRNRYGDASVKQMRKFEKFDFRERKIELDLQFLRSCRDKKLAPSFLRFRVSNSNLRSSEAYAKSQLLLLNEEIKLKEALLHTTRNQTKRHKEILCSSVSTIDFAHICSVAICGNDNRLNKVAEIQDRKLFQLSNKTYGTGNDPDKVIHNYSTYKLSDTEKSLLVKGLNYAIAPKRLQYGEYCINFELLYRDIHRLNIEDKSKEDFIKCKLKNIALTSFYDYNKSNHVTENLTPSEFKTLKDLASNKNIIIQKSDKGNSVVILDKSTYLSEMTKILSDSTKFKPLSEKIKNKELQYITEKEDKIRKFLKKLYEAKKITKNQFDSLYPKGSQPGVMYGLAKVHKQVTNGVPKFRPILSAIGTCSYKLAKFFVPFLADICKNEYTITDSFQFGKTVLEQDSTLYMGSLDVEALFTSLPLVETLDITVNEMFKTQTTIAGLNKDEFRTLLEYASYEPWFIFDEKYFQQIDGVSMGSPLGPSLANIFMSYHERRWLQNCPEQFKPVFYRRYVDLFRSPNDINLFKDYLNACHANIKFTTEEEKDNSMPFLDFLFVRENGKFTSSVYRKPTFTGVYTHFQSLIPDEYKIGLISTLLHRIYNISSSFINIVTEVNNLKNIMRKNGYPKSVIDKCIFRFFNKIFTTKKQVQTAEKKKLLLVLPYLGKFSLQTKNNLLKLFKKTLPFCDLQILFKTEKRLCNFFPFKDKVPLSLVSHNVYYFKCSGCNSCYYGLAERHTKVRWCDHVGISWRTGSKIVGVQTEIKDHTKTCAYTPTLDDFKIISKDNDSLKLRIKESLYIKKDRTNLNKNVYSTPLYLF